MPLYRDEPGGRREVSAAELDAMQRRERAELEIPAVEHANRAREVFRSGGAILEDWDRAQSAAHEAMSLLAEGFHVLRKAPGTRPWDPDALYDYAFTASPTETGLHAIRFVLTVWNNQCIESFDEDRGRSLGSFQAVDAMAQWDAGNRAAFVTWCRDPWWP